MSVPESNRTPGLSILFKEFLASEKAGGVILLVCTIVSLLITNSSLGTHYIHLWHQKVDISVGVPLIFPIEYWINDGLMAVFFLLVGLEIRRELLIGELADKKKASLPVVAAIGGMVVPALIHFSFNAHTTTQSGFGIPMATDIAFALGMLSLLGNRVPASLKIFLAALAIIDDLGAILIIAIFYTASINWNYLGAAGGLYIVLLLMNRFKVRNLAPYIFLGFVLWYWMLRSGVHATIAGVLLAFVIPFGNGDKNSGAYLVQHALHKPVAFIILPLFALANTSLILSTGWYHELDHPNNLGILLGLVIGKPIGIFLFCLLMVQLKWSALPEAVSWKHIAGVGVLAGIGFTMSIFISNLAFTDTGIIQSSKITVLISSGIACIIGLMVLYITRNKEKQV